MKEVFAICKFINRKIILEKIKVINFTDFIKFQKAIVKRLDSISKLAISERNIFHIALTGGETARSIYPKFLDLQTDWSKWHFWYGDERVLPEGHKDLNSVMAEKTFLNQLSCNESQVHKIPVFLGGKRASQLYSKYLEAIDYLDLILLGLGEDGHVASLFPNTDWHKLNDLSHAISIQNSPKAPSERVSMSFYRIQKSRKILVISKGLSKLEIINRIQYKKDTILNKLSPVEQIEIFYLQK
ncbi:6-phosphogluconolactonase [Leptospira levettii]|uniref:6-phosphogluconolactonase n=1 Tax=Leptospira levettii TaxID=2023178 RepID=UPI00142DD105|nr:6-phosphogluconolactonase [Leptospira levettii]